MEPFDGEDGITLDKQAYEVGKRESTPDRLFIHDLSTDGMTSVNQRLVRRLHSGWLALDVGAQ